MHLVHGQRMDEVNAVIAAEEFLRSLADIRAEVHRINEMYIISRCNDHGKIVEINNASLSIRKGSHDNCMDIARLCMKYEVPISVDSDSHICYRVGHVEGALEMLEEIGFPEELIINSSVERLNNYFKGRGLHLFDEEDLL